MGIVDWLNKLKKEKKVLEGDAVKNKTYSSNNVYPTNEIAVKEFHRAKEKLFNVNKWSELPGLSSSFQLYSSRGEKIYALKPEIGNYVKIVLPAPALENWVNVIDIKEHENSAEFTVSPSPNPTEKEKGQEEIEHFFIDEATSTFKVELQNKKLHAYEIGKNEGINNEGAEAGKRKLINTLVAEGGWAGFQKFQWKKLTDYLVHQIEIEEKS